MTRLAVLTSHPIQYYAPLFRELSRHIDMHVFFAHNATANQQSEAGFGHAFEWDVDLVSDYSNSFLKNVSKTPNATQFSGCDTPEVRHHLQSGKFDAVLSLGWHLKSLLQGIWAAKRLGMKVMVRGDSQLSTPRSPLKRVAKAAIYPRLLKTFDVAYYVGSRSREYYRHYAYPETRLIRSPHCIDTVRFENGATADAREDLRRSLNVSPETVLIGFAGKLIDFKRPIDVIDSVAALSARGLDCAAMFVGSGPLEAALKNRAKEAGVTAHFLGFQNQSQMPRAYAGADIIVLPSTGRETWGLVCNEALAANTPIVVSDAVGCAPDLVADGSAGRQFPLGDVTACADQIADLVQSPPSRLAIKQKSDAFSLEAAATGIVDGVEMACSDKTRNRTR